MYFSSLCVHKDRCISGRQLLHFHSFQTFDRTLQATFQQMMPSSVAIAMQRLLISVGKLACWPFAMHVISSTKMAFPAENTPLGRREGENQWSMAFGGRIAANTDPNPPTPITEAKSPKYCIAISSRVFSALRLHLGKHRHLLKEKSKWILM